MDKRRVVVTGVGLITPLGLDVETSWRNLVNGNKKIGVFCEKPLAVNPRQVKEMIDASIQNHTLLQDGIIPLYTENYLKLKESLASIGRLRRAVFVMGRYSSRYDAYLRGENPTTFRREYCNGFLVDMGVYCVAVAVG